MPIVQELKAHPVAVGVGLATLVVTYALFRRSRSSGGTVAPNTGGGVIQPGYNNDQNLSYLIQSLSDQMASWRNNPSGGGTGPTPTGTPTGSASAPWWQNILHDNPAQGDTLHAASNPGGFWTVPVGETFNQIATLFGLQHGWTDLAYNPYNQSLLSQAYSSQGQGIVPAGTQIYIPFSDITGTPPAAQPSTPDNRVNGTGLPGTFTGQPVQPLWKITGAPSGTAQPAYYHPH